MAHKILAIDDSLTFRKFISKALTQTPGRYEVTLAVDGTQGLDLLSSNPELILLDFVLPDISGDEVCARIATIPGADRIPIVLMSSSVESIQATAAKYPNVKGMVAKPFTPELLNDTVEQLLLAQPEAAAPGSTAPADNTPVSGAGEGFSGSTSCFSLIKALMAAQRQRLTGVFSFTSGGQTHRLACRGGMPLGMMGDKDYLPHKQGLKTFGVLWTQLDVTFAFDTAAALPATTPQNLPGNMLEWAIESLRRVHEEAESSYAWGDSTGIPAFNREGYDRIQRVALLEEEIEFIKQVDARTGVDAIAMRMGWPLSKAHQVLFRLLCLEIFDFWPAAILNANRG